MGQIRSEIVPSTGLVTRRLNRVTQSGIGMLPTVVRRVGRPHGECEPRGGLDTRVSPSGPGVAPAARA